MLINMIVKVLVIKYQDGVTETLPPISFEETVNSYHQGHLYLTRCSNELGVQTFDESYREALIGDLSKPLTRDDYWRAYDEIV